MRPRDLFFFIACAGIAAAQSAPITVVNAASYRSTLAPDSFASIFGAGLATSTATATLDANGNLPLELASTHVDVNGQAAPLFYVSPTQINFVVPHGVGTGTTTLTVSYTNSSVTRVASVPVAASAPALFSSDASGAGPGAILNAVTFAATPFLVETPENNNGDLRTRLALYGTGFRNATKVTVRAVDTRANAFNATVEYAGAAPGYFGLDQLNVVLPAGLDGGGAVSLTVTADDIVSNTVTAQINLMPISRLHLASITLDPNFVSGGDPMTATVSLNGVARSGGFQASLRSTILSAQTPIGATIPENTASIPVTVTTSSVSNVQTGSVQASAGGVTVSADFEVDPASQSQLSSVAVSSSSVLGGRNLTGIVTISAPAPASGVSIQLSSDSDPVRLPAVVMVPFNQTSATFSIATVAVPAEVNAVITATLSRTSVTTKLKVLPTLSFTVDNASVTGGTSITGTITLGEPAPASGATISLSSSNAIIARPGSLTIPSGQSSGTFTITTTSVTSALTAVITASYLGNSQTVSVTVNPPAAATLDSVVLSPSTVIGGNTVQGTVKLTAAAGFGGQRIDLQSSALLTAQVPSFITIPQGGTSAQFNVTTSRVSSSQSVTITARMGTASKTAVLIVQ